MENEIILTDKNGQRIDDLQKYYDDNPEILKRHIEKLNENKKWEPSESLFNPENVKLLIEVHEVGVFRKTFKSFYLNWLNEIQTHSKNKNFLLEQKEKAQRFIDDSNNEIAYRPDNLMIKKNGKYVINTMKSLQNEIGAFLSRLEREKAQSNTNGGKGDESPEKDNLACNNNVESALKKVELILDDINDLIFGASTPKQWEQVLNNETPKTPIIAKGNITIKDVVYLFEKLCDVGVFRIQYKTDLADIKAFKIRGKFIKSQTQLTTALSGCRKKQPQFKKQLDKIFSKFKAQT